MKGKGTYESLEETAKTLVDTYRLAGPNLPHYNTLSTDARAYLPVNLFDPWQDGYWRWAVNFVVGEIHRQWHA